MDRTYCTYIKAIEAAARADSDAQPLTSGDLKLMKRTPPAKIIRRALGLTQEEFVDHYHIRLGTLRDWEQGRAEPDQPTQAYGRYPSTCRLRVNRNRIYEARGPSSQEAGRHAPQRLPFPVAE
jgi:DNA-binding transcriptional regulator YiaG